RCSAPCARASGRSAKMRGVSNQDADHVTDKKPSGDRGGLDGFFRISERDSSVAQELRGGLVTFLTMAYIIVLNPLILGFVPDSEGMYLGGGAEPGSGIPAIAAATALV